ncbi:16753_t:CDS:2 [Acaulospora morrowiae]|uniref:16753_t:CDS:1 n=1 Tax=Acaulospora morrowiae TaxID=94023 RepID=A0A9N9AF92_9GLOM|nr:16753_t:CDS:2 [Acaulospora morrowiae]
MTVVATWKETNRRLRLWEIIEGQTNLKLAGKKIIPKELELHPTEIYEFYSHSRLTISDSKHLALHLKTDNICIYNLNTENQNRLSAPDLENKMDSWSFIKNDDFIVVKGEPIYRAYIFSYDKRDSDNWNCKRMIELKYFTWSYIDFNEKLFLAIEDTLILSQWNLDGLVLEQQYMLESSKRCRITQNRNSTLLVVQELDVLFIYSMELGMRLTRLEESNSKISFIGTDIGERMMISGTWGNCNIVDPFELHPQDNLKGAKKLFGNVETGMPYVIQLDKVIGWFKKDLCIRSLIPDEWIKHLRKELKDFKGFGSSYEVSQVKDMVDKIKNNITGITFKDQLKPYDDGLGFQYSYEGSLLEWIVRIDADYESAYIELAAHEFESKTEKWRRVEPKRIFSRHKENYGKDFIINCNPLANENLAMITRAGIYIWTVNSKNEIRRIQLLYFWDNELKRKNFETSSIINMLKNFLLSCAQSKNYLPTMNFTLVLKDSHLNPVCRQEWIDYYKNDKMFLAHYGTPWIKRLIDLKEDQMIYELLKRCIELSIEHGRIKNTIFLGIIATSFPELSQNYRAYVSEFLSRLAFVVPCRNKDLELINRYSTFKHLHHYGTYIQISETSSVDRVISWLFYRKTRDFISKIGISTFKSEPNLTIRLMIPLPKFVTYPDSYNSLMDFIYPAPSPFVMSYNIDLYKILIGEALLNFKWNTYGRKYYFIVWGIYTIFLCSFVIAATLSNQIPWNVQRYLLEGVIALGVYHLIFEIRQLIFSPIFYITSPWNYFDLGAIIFPIMTSCIWLQSGTIPTWEATISTLLLELKFLFYFRALDYFGVYFAIIIGVAGRVFSFLVILGIILFAFANSLYLLLRPTTDYSLDVLTDSSDPNNPWNLAKKYGTISDGVLLEGTSFIELPDESTNMFTGLLSSILATYLMLTAHVAMIREMLKEIPRDELKLFQGLLNAIQMEPAESVESQKMESLIKRSVQESIMELQQISKIETLTDEIKSLTKKLDEILDGMQGLSMKE